MVSVIVATRNRSGILPRCIDSLIAQEASKDLFEIIIVDNDSTDDTAKVIHQYVSLHPNIVGIKEVSIGSSAPRNAGIKIARYEWLAFIDDDGWVEPNFITEVIKEGNRNIYACFGGWFIPWYIQPKLKWMKDEWFSYPKFLSTTGDLDPKLYLPCGILIVNRGYMNELGGFPENLGIINGKMGFAEENWIQYELRKRNLRIGFVPSLVLHHLVAPVKYHLSWHLKRLYYKGRDWQHINGKIHVFEKIKRIIRGSLAAIYLLVKNLPRLLTQKNYYFQQYIIECLSYALRMWGSVK